MLIGNIGQRIRDRNQDQQKKLNIEQFPVRQKNQKHEYGDNIYAPPPVKNLDEKIKVLQTKHEKEEKEKYIIGDTKEEIIANIIREKPSVANVRKALTAYADIIMDEELF